MYKVNRSQNWKRISSNKAYEGESIEEKVKRITTNKEPIADGSPLIFTERKHGINKAYDIRTDRFELAVEAKDAVNKSIRAGREHKNKIGEEAKKGMEKEANNKKDGEAEPIQTTDKK